MEDFVCFEAVLDKLDPISTLNTRKKNFQMFLMIYFRLVKADMSLHSQEISSLGNSGFGGTERKAFQKELIKIYHGVKHRQPEEIANEKDDSFAAGESRRDDTLRRANADR